jgi:hypothetical protein
MKIIIKKMYQQQDIALLEARSGSPTKSGKGDDDEEKVMGDGLAFN